MAAPAKTPAIAAQMTSSSEHPCLTCGACCASFRVDFAVEETQECGGSVPDGLVVPVTDYTARMRGTDHASPRCAALTGKVGVKAACGIYEWRPSPCREFEAGSDACQRARARHGMPVLDDPLAA
ncbi:YkgJ family cysteine cluster protein [Diaphorobacter sp. HDW4A]|nr:YkgJ family cysteine cluster protein [Diaphorobacter sp. HDW4A]